MFKKFLKGFFAERKSVISIDGVTYEGNSLTITRDGNIIIDGELKTTANGPNVSVDIKGDINELSLANGYITVEGDVNNANTKSGDIEVGGDIFNGASTVSGDIEVGGNIEGNVTTVSGDVEARKIVGFVKTVSGDIN